jgi:predicted DNA-binding protein (MmcQ/YjbR family)
MITLEEFRKLALSFPDTSEQPHFDSPSFRVNNKIFATYWNKDNRAMLLLSLVDQSAFCSIGKNIFFPVPNAWGKQGATFVELKKVRKNMFKDAVKTSYEFIASKNKLAKTKKKK